MRILVYKRTLQGDPGPDGCFGVYDCMGSIRGRDYDAVIGVGGIGSSAETHDIARKVNWIGLGPHKTEVGKRGPEVTFDHFVFYGADGPDLRALAPELAHRLHDRNVRSILDGMSDAEQNEAEAIIARADEAPPSPVLSGERIAIEDLRRCAPTCSPSPCNSSPGEQGVEPDASPAGELKS